MSDELKWLTVRTMQFVLIVASFIIVLALVSNSSAEVILEKDALLTSLASENKISFYSNSKMFVSIILQSFVFLV